MEHKAKVFYSVFACNDREYPQLVNRQIKSSHIEMSIVLGRFPGNAASRGRAIRHTRYVLLSLTQHKTMLRMAHFSI